MPAFSLEKSRQPTIPEPRPLANHGPQSRTQCRLIRARFRVIALRGSRDSHHRTSPSLGGPELLTKLDDRRTLLRRAHQFFEFTCLSI